METTMTNVHLFNLDAIKTALRSIDVDTAKSNDDLILISVLQEVIESYDAGAISTLVDDAD